MWCKVSCGWVELRKEKRCRYHPERHHSEAPGFLICFFFFLFCLTGENIKMNFCKRLCLLPPWTLQTMPLQIHCWAKKSHWGCKLSSLFKGFKQPSWKIMETQIPQDTVSHKAHPLMDKAHCAQLLYLKALQISETGCEIF